MRPLLVNATKTSKSNWQQLFISVDIDSLPNVFIVIFVLVTSFQCELISTQFFKCLPFNIKKV